MPRKTRPLRWIRPPRQQRSERTQHRLLDAAEALLADRAFEQLTVADVVRKARSSVGAFYARFSGKEALLDALYERHQQEAMVSIEHAFDPAHWQGASVEEIVRQVVRFTLRLYRDNRGLMRTLVMRGHARPDWRYGDPQERSKSVLVKIDRLLGPRVDEISHPNPELAASLGFLMVLATLREKILFGESTARAVRVGDRALERELVDAYLSYLGVRSQGKMEG